jgi:hypothetical protein
LSRDRPRVSLAAQRTRVVLRVGERTRYGLVIDPATGRVRMGRVQRRPKRD